MPLVMRSIRDMIGHFSTGLANIMVNPVTCSGEASAGLSKAFFEKWPAMHEDYLKMCQSGALTIGKLHIYRDGVSKTTIINLPTKKNWKDIVDPVDIETGCTRLAEYLKTRPFDTVAMPLLGVGYSRQEKLTIDPILTRHLDPLPNIIHLSIRPDRFEKPPLYLAVAGSRAYTNYDKIWIGIAEGLIQFEKSFSDFEAMVSGGAKGVDRIACGAGITDLSPNIATNNGLRPIVCQANWEDYGNSAGFIRNRTVVDIGTHFVAFVGSESVGTRGLVELVTRHNNYVDRVTASAVIPTGSDIFDRPYIPPPEKKYLYICDVSAETR